MSLINASTLTHLNYFYVIIDDRNSTSFSQERSSCARRFWIDHSGKSFASTSISELTSNTCPSHLGEVHPGRVDVTF